MVVAVAEESRGADHARPWIEQAKSDYWQLIDEEHRLEDLYNLVNVPQAIWIDEAGKIVRPPETAGSTDHFRRMDLKTRTMSPEDQAERLAARQAYMDAVRAWVTTGKHALPADAARAEPAQGHARDRRSAGALPARRLAARQRPRGRGRSADGRGEPPPSRVHGACGARRPISTRSARPADPTSGSACKRWATSRIIRLPNSRREARCASSTGAISERRAPTRRTASRSRSPAFRSPSCRLPSADYFLLMAEPGCCQGCVPNNPLAVIEIVADRPLKLGNGALRLSGTWHVSTDPGRLALSAPRRRGEARASRAARCWRPARSSACRSPAMAQTTDGTAVDLHSHAGNLIRDELRTRRVSPTSPIRCGRAACPTICLAIVGRFADHQRHQAAASGPGAIRQPGELYDFSQRASSPTLHALAREPGDADRQDRRRSARGASEPALDHRRVGGRRLPRRQDRAPRRGLPALAAAPPAAHALPAERAGRHPDRAQSSMAA